MSFITSNSSVAPSLNFSSTSAPSTSSSVWPWSPYITMTTCEEASPFGTSPVVAHTFHGMPAKVHLFYKYCYSMCFNYMTTLMSRKKSVNQLVMCKPTTLYNCPNLFINQVKIFIICNNTEFFFYICNACGSTLHIQIKMFL